MHITNAEYKVSLELKEIAKKLEAQLRKITGQTMLFSLIIFNTEEGSRMSYVSNASREDVIDAMKSLIEGWENGMPDIPAHKII